MSGVDTTQELVQANFPSYLQDKMAGWTTVRQIGQKNADAG
jgi:hypothetical protein